MNKKMTSLKAEMLRKGVSEKNFDYVYQAVKSGTKREFIRENLTSDVRKVAPEMADEILDRVFEAFGGEFRQENATGYLYASAYFLMTLALLGFIIAIWNGAVGNLRYLIFSVIGFFFFLYKGVTTLMRAIRGKYRED
ncbi:hypothetical protein [Bergeyella sp. RCAD1439]|uniref:hypothetical protein n=1 Tax=Bergeyella anatis TaxID=3113737 RepID=UPI002E187A37|nr:hypothetical protein [Bergeyella sp. RCAD1439]